MMIDDDNCCFKSLQPGFAVFWLSLAFFPSQAVKKLYMGLYKHCVFVYKTSIVNIV